MHKELVRLLHGGFDARMWEARSVESSVELPDATIDFANQPTKQEHFAVEW